MQMTFSKKKSAYSSQGEIVYTYIYTCTYTINTINEYHLQWLNCFGIYFLYITR